MRFGDVEYPTISEARVAFGGVSEKTIRQWIAKGIIERPPEVDMGARSVMTFPAGYLSKAKEALARHRRERKNNHR